MSKIKIITQFGIIECSETNVKKGYHNLHIKTNAIDLILPEEDIIKTEIINDYKKWEIRQKYNDKLILFHIWAKYFIIEDGSVFKFYGNNGLIAEIPRILIYDVKEVDYKND